MFAIPLGIALLRSGRAVEAEDHIHKCLEKAGSYGHPIIFNHAPISIALAIRAEVLLMQGRKEEALATVERMGGRSFYAGDWKGYYAAIQIGMCEKAHDASGLDFLPLLSSILCDPSNPTTVARANQHLRIAKACQERGDLDEAEEIFWQAVASYKQTKKGSDQQR